MWHCHCHWMSSFPSSLSPQHVNQLLLSTFPWSSERTQLHCPVEEMNVTQAWKHSDHDLHCKQRQKQSTEAFNFFLQVRVVLFWKANQDLGWGESKRQNWLSTSRQWQWPKSLHTMAQQTGDWGIGGGRGGGWNSFHKENAKERIGKWSSSLHGSVPLDVGGNQEHM